MFSEDGQQRQKRSVDSSELLMSRFPRQTAVRAQTPVTSVMGMVSYLINSFDCTSGHDTYPSQFQVDWETQMLGSVHPYNRQVGVRTVFPSSFF